MQPYDAPGPTNWKALKDKVAKIRFRFFGSTHASPTKKRIVRNGKKRARRVAKQELINEQTKK